MGNQLGADSLQPYKSHIEHHCLVLFRQLIPVQIDTAVFQVSSDETHGLRAVTMGQWDTRVAGATRCGSDTRNDLKGNILCRESIDLLTAASKNERVSPFET